MSDIIKFKSCGKIHRCAFRLQGQKDRFSTACFYFTSPLCLISIYKEETKRNAMKIRIKGSNFDRECYEF